MAIIIKTALFGAGSVLLKDTSLYIYYSLQLFYNEVAWSTRPDPHSCESKILG